MFTPVHYVGLELVHYVGLEQGQVQGSGESGGLVVCHPLGGSMCRNHAQDTALAGEPRKWQLGCWSFCVLLFVICPNCNMQVVIFSRLQFLRILLPEEMLMQVLQQGVPAPSLSQYST